jgi:hypothetical protein
MCTEYSAHIKTHHISAMAILLPHHHLFLVTSYPSLLDQLHRRYQPHLCHNEFDFALLAGLRLACLTLHHHKSNVEMLSLPRHPLKPQP